MNEKNSGRFRGAVALPLILIIITGIYLAEALRSMRPFEEGTAGPSFFPIVVSIVMIAALAPLLWKALRGNESDKQDEKSTAVVAIAEPVKVVLLTIGYIAAFKPAGYFISTAVYVLALLYVFKFKGRKPFVNVFWAVLIAGVCFLLFSEIFQIRLPKLGGII